MTMTSTAYRVPMPVHTIRRRVSAERHGGEATALVVEGSRRAATAAASRLDRASATKRAETPQGASGATRTPETTPATAMLDHNSAKVEACFAPGTVSTTRAWVAGSMIS